MPNKHGFWLKANKFSHSVSKTLQRFALKRRFRPALFSIVLISRITPNNTQWEYGARAGIMRNVILTHFDQRVILPTGIPFGDMKLLRSNTHT